MFPHTTLNLSGQRFTVTYRLVAADEAAATTKATGICLEQTVELPAQLLVGDDIQAEVVGRLERLSRLPDGHFEAVISYASETAGAELPQLLNVIFGNSSMQRGIQVIRFDLPDSLLAAYPGPRFGRAGLRRFVNVPERPLLCTALKPMGLAAPDLAHLAHQFALGGIDLIKDDHGLANQMFAPFEERVQRCAEAVNTANAQSGQRCLYLPNITGPADRVIERAYFAKAAGAGGVMLAPGLAGLDFIRLLAADDSFGLPLLSHPALRGSFVSNDNQGLAYGLSCGQLPRLAGADASIYVNFGGRFGFSRAGCRHITETTGEPMGHLLPIFPCPGGGMTLENLPEMVDFYGREVILLIAGGLYGHGPNLGDNCRRFKETVEGLLSR
ncbi:MAG: ribulose 1,5-bisphosphate carboxylase large subunit [Anaerolineae bacterium]|nr:ribulose 1,5-bisphosphate carboxylase large subunit [Anaerolineae bacterium]